MIRMLIFSEELLEILSYKIVPLLILISTFLFIFDLLPIVTYICLVIGFLVPEILRLIVKNYLEKEIGVDENKQSKGSNILMVTCAVLAAVGWSVFIFFLENH